jgi:hypothetical protein
MRIMRLHDELDHDIIMIHKATLQLTINLIIECTYSNIVYTHMFAPINLIDWY